MSIKDFFKCHKIMDVMNVCLVTANETTSIQKLTFDAFMRVWNETRWKVKVNASIGCILVHKTTGKYRYFHSSVNNGALFEQPAILSTNAEAEELLENINSLDLQEKAFRARPNTECGLFAMTNMTFYFYKMIGISRAGGADELPTYVKRNIHLLSLLTDAKSGKAYNDKLCFFDVSLFDSIVSVAIGASVRGLEIEQLSVCFASRKKQKTLHRLNFQASMKRNFCFWKNCLSPSQCLSLGRTKAAQFCGTRANEKPLMGDLIQTYLQITLATSET